MTFRDFESLERGDVIRHKIGGDSFIVDANHGDRITAVRTIDVTNPVEWDIVRKVKNE